MSTASEWGPPASRILVLELVPGLNGGYGLSRIQFLEGLSLRLARLVADKERQCLCGCGGGEHPSWRLVIVGVELVVGFRLGG